MNNSDHSDRLAFLNIDDGTRAALAALRPIAEKRLPGILDGFYRHVGGWQQAAAHFKDARHMAQARQRQIDHWTMILSGRFDDAYVASVRAIGQAHHRIGLDPQWYIGGYAFIIAGLMRAATEAAAGQGGVRGMIPGLKARSMKTGGAKRRGPALADLHDAILRAALLDMDYAISIYLEEGRAEKERTLGGLAEAFESGVGEVVQAIGAATNQLNATAQTMGAVAEETSKQASAVAAATHQASANVETVASATEELASSIREIEGQIGTSTTVAASAKDDAEAAKTRSRP
jgi:hypothetical protein